MKNLVFLLLILGLGSSLSAQVRSAHYEVSAPDAGEAAAWSRELERRFEIYNSIFRFDPAMLPELLKVRIFTVGEEYESYTASRLGSPGPGAVYLHYNRAENRELVILRGGENEKKFVPHQAFVQFLRGFIPQPPPWLLEGFAVFFSNLAYNREQDSLVYEENLAWLETVKSIDPSGIPLETLFLAEKKDLPHFQALSWSLAAFFAEESSAYHRDLTDAIMVLSPSAGAGENAQALYKRLTLFNGIDSISKDYHACLGAKKTFAELMDEGQRAYREKDAAAADLFRLAADTYPGQYAPYYYLGLLAYEKNSYPEAEEFYKTALEKGADKALIQYALGVNAAAAGKKDEAAARLTEAAQADPEKYKVRAEDLIKRLP